MRRFLYRLLIHSHPRRFRERFGDEMLSIFDEMSPRNGVVLITDGVVSLLRQRILRSNLWKMASGAAISAFVLCLWASGVQSSMGASPELIMRQAMRLQWQPPTSESRLDREEFQREAASAVALLAEMRKKDELARRVLRN